MFTKDLPIDRCLRWLLAAGCLVLVSGVLRAQGPVSDPFTDGARWCFLGDGGTQHGSYVTWMTAYVVTRFQDRVVDVFNAGLHGDTARRAVDRFSWDVGRNRPTHVWILFGGNDVSVVPGSVTPSAGDPASDRARAIGDHRSGLRVLVDMIRNAGAVPMLVGPALDDVEAAGSGARNVPGADDLAASGRDIARDVAGETGAEFVDLHESFGRLARERPKEDVSSSTSGRNRTVSGPPGQLVVAWILLKKAGATAEVATLSIDLRSGRFTAGNSTVDKVVRTESELMFVWTARALPMPLADDVLPALSWAPVVDDLSRETLQVAGLSPGRWVLSIDGIRVADFSNQQLESGVNLATVRQTPQYRQTCDVMRLLEARQRLVDDNVRSVVLVEHRSAPTLARPITAEQMQSILAAHRPDAAETSYVREAYDLYGQRKSREAASIAAASRLMTQARRAAWPQSHVYLLRLGK